VWWWWFSLFNLSFFFFFDQALPEGLSILLVFLKIQLLISLFLFIKILFHFCYSLFCFLSLFALGLICSFSGFLRWMVRLLIPPFKVDIYSYKFPFNHCCYFISSVLVCCVFVFISTYFMVSHVISLI